MHRAPNVEDRRTEKVSRPGVPVRQSIGGVASHCSTVAFVAMTAHGGLFGEEDTEVKSEEPGNRTIEERQPAGNAGGTAASNVSS